MKVGPSMRTFLQSLISTIIGRRRIGRSGRALPCSAMSMFAHQGAPWPSKVPEPMMAILVRPLAKRQGMRAVFGKAFPARSDVGIFGAIGLEKNHRSGVNLQRHVDDQVNRPGEKMTGRNADNAPTGFLAIGNGFPERVSTRNFGIIHSTIIGDVEDRSGRRPGGDAAGERAN